MHETMTEIGSIAYSDNELGGGTYGIVYGGTFRDDENGDRIKVAVKRIQRVHVNTDLDTDDREVNALKKLTDHPNVIRFYGAEKNKDF